MSSSRRETNEYRRRVFGYDPDRVVAFVCECADDDCRSTVSLKPAAYDRAREDGRALVADGAHAAADHARTSGKARRARGGST